MKEVNEGSHVSCKYLTKAEDKSFLLPWDRFWARCIDLTILLIITYLILKLSGHSTWPTNHNIYKIIKFWIVISVIFIIYDSFFLKIFATTPGKTIFKIRITNSDENKLSYRSTFIRAIVLFWYGFNFYLLGPVGLIIGFGLSSLHYKKTGSFKWDKLGNCIVNQDPLTPLRRNLIYYSLLFIMTLLLFLSLALGK